MKESIGPPLNRKGEPITDDTKKAEVLNAYFALVFTES